MAETPAKPRRPLLRYSLRGLLLLTAVAAVPLAWLGWTLQAVRQQQFAVAELEKMGCHVYDCGYLSGRSMPSKWIEMVLGETVPMNVNYASCRDSRFSDASLAYLREMTRLRSLHFAGTQLTDAGLVHLKGLIHLKNVDFSRTRLTGSGVIHLAGLRELKTLVLSDTLVTDAELVYFQGLTQLSELELCGTKVTDAGVQNLKKALPNCDISAFE